MEPKMSKPDGGPAFPHTLDMVSGGNTRGGMSLRDWFAGMALNGMIAGAYERGAQVGFVPPTTLASEAFAYADAMIAEGEK